MLVDHQLPPSFNPDVPIDDPEVLQEMQRAVSAKEKRSVHTLPRSARCLRCSLVCMSV